MNMMIKSNAIGLITGIIIMFVVFIIYAICCSSVAGFMQGDYVLGTVVFIPTFLILSFIAYMIRLAMDDYTGDNKKTIFSNEDSKKYWNI